MNTVVKTGKTIEEALDNALKALSCSIDEIDYEILENDSKGFFGLFGTKEAKIKVTRKKSFVEEEIKKIKKDTKIVKEKIENITNDFENEKVEEVEELKKDDDIDSLTYNFIEKVLLEMGMNLEINISSSNNIINVDLEGDDISRIIGKNGKTLDSLQYLVAMVVNKNREDYNKVFIDANGYKRRKKESIEKLAVQMANKAVKLRKDIIMRPMNAYERRIVHFALQNDKRVRTKSDGRDPYRKIIIFLNR